MFIPHQTLGEITSQIKKEMQFTVRKYQRWKVSSYITRFITVFVKTNLFSSELFKVTQARIWTFRRCFIKSFGKATRHFCTMLDSREMKVLSHQDELCEEGLEPAKAGKQCTSHSCRHCKQNTVHNGTFPAGPRKHAFKQFLCLAQGIPLAHDQHETCTCHMVSR